jgi:hypothetical protein
VPVYHQDNDELLRELLSQAKNTTTKRNVVNPFSVILIVAKSISHFSTRIQYDTRALLNFTQETQNFISILNLLFTSLGLVVASLACLAAFVVVPRISEFLNLDMPHKAISATVTENSSFIISDTSSVSKTMYLIALELESTGDQTIQETDYREPIVFIFPDAYSISKADVKNINQKYSGMKVNHNRNVAALSKTLINPGDKFLVIFCMADNIGLKNTPTFDIYTRIAGLTSDIKVSHNIHQKQIQPELLCAN